MGQAFFVFIVSVFAALTVQAADCSHLVNSCEYYQCLETQEQCGAKGYYLKFGKHYCEKYQANEAEYSEAGREFLVNIRSCLQDELEREITRANRLPKCDKVEKFAVGTHRYCYQKFGFCNLPSKDRTRVKLTAKKELIHFRMIIFGLWLEKACFGD